VSVCAVTQTNRKARRRLFIEQMALWNRTLWLALGLVCATMADAGTPAQALREADAICHRDNGALWGVSLRGPILLVDPATRSIFANQPGGKHELKAEGQIFVGKLPDEMNVANTAVDWAGTKWTMIMLPLPEAKDRRAALMAHEMWHRVQGEIGLPQSAAANDHLDTRDGRYWLQLEWRALAAALRATGDGRADAIRDAAIFRARRRQLFLEAAKTEREMELHEGLAEYTGVRLSGSADPARFVADVELKDAPAKKTFVRSFAYATGPAYGVLLDGTGADWRETLRAARRDLADLLLERARIRLPDQIEAAANERARKYGSVELAAKEQRREQARLDLAKSYRAKLVDGRVLVIPLQKMNMQFDPGNLVPLDPLGTVYPNIRIVDDWGILTVSKNGALMSTDFSRITLPAPGKVTPPAIDGEGWNLRLNGGWSVVPGQRQGDLAVRSER
jgi:hypothetical protein